MTTHFRAILIILYIANSGKKRWSRTVLEKTRSKRSFGKGMFVEAFDSNPGCVAGQSGSKSIKSQFSNRTFVWPRTLATQRALFGQWSATSRPKTERALASANLNEKKPQFDPISSTSSPSIVGRRGAISCHFGIGRRIAACSRVNAANDIVPRAVDHRVRRIIGSSDTELWKFDTLIPWAAANNFSPELLSIHLGPRDLWSERKSAALISKPKSADL